MPSMTVADMATYVRTVLDTDDTELPDLLLNVWRDEGTSRVERSFEPWVFYKQSWTLAVSQGTASVQLNGGLTPSDQECERVTAIGGDQWQLKYIPHEIALIRYHGNQDVSGTPFEGQPVEYSVDAGELFLWPVPDASYSYVVWGYRKPTPAVTPTDTVDIPSEFHPLIAEWMLARAYEQQDDDVMSTQKFNRFELELNALKRRYTRGPNAGVQAIGEYCESEGPWYPYGPQSLDRLRYAWG